MQRVVLLTGVTGFVGSHLAERLLADGDVVHGLAVESPPYPNLAATGGRVHIHRGDLTDLDAVRRAIEESQPEVVVHLAGQAVPTLAAADPLGAIHVNVMGTATVLVALAGYRGVRLVAASSAEVYGEPAHLPASEDEPLRPRNVYAASKVAAEALLREQGDRGVTAVTILRPANQNGPRQHPGLAASAWAKQIAEAEAGIVEPVIRHGDLTARRDFVDVRDMADAFARASRLAEPGAHTYNVGSGTALSMDELLAALVSEARVALRTELDPARVRPGGPSVLALDAARFSEATGWQPRIPLARSLRDLLDYWREAVGRGSTASAGARAVRQGSGA